MRIFIGLTAIAAILAFCVPAFAMSEGEQEIRFKAKCIDLTMKDVMREIEGLRVKARPDELAGIILVLRELKGLAIKEQWDINQDLQALRNEEARIAASRKATKKPAPQPKPAKKRAKKALEKRVKVK